jgi:hypothetical protein
VEPLEEVVVEVEVQVQPRHLSMAPHRLVEEAVGTRVARVVTTSLLEGLPRLLVEYANFSMAHLSLLFFRISV